MGEKPTRGGSPALLHLSKSPSLGPAERGRVVFLLVGLTLIMENDGASSSFAASREALHFKHQFRVDGSKPVPTLQGGFTCEETLKTSFTR